MTTDKTKRKLIAVVHADVKGYSRMMGEDDEYTVRTLASNRQEMYRLVELHGGQVRDTAGDGFLVEFSSVVDAVKFSVEFQREMKKRNADIPEAKKMEFRIGVNIGDVIQDGGTIYGDGVNIAARLESLADPGGICISGAAYEQVKKRLDLGFEYVGDKSVKNIAEPVPTYKVLIEHGEPAEPKEKSQQGQARGMAKELSHSCCDRCRVGGVGRNLVLPLPFRSAARQGSVGRSACTQAPRQALHCSARL